MKVLLFKKRFHGGVTVSHVEAGGMGESFVCFLQRIDVIPRPSFRNAKRVKICESKDFIQFNASANTPIRK